MRAHLEPAHLLRYLFTLALVVAAMQPFAVNAKLNEHYGQKGLIICKNYKSQTCFVSLVNMKKMRKTIMQLSNLGHECGRSTKRNLDTNNFQVYKSASKDKVMIECKRNQTVETDIRKLLKTHPHGLRMRREIGPSPRGRYRGQTQSQYLNINEGNGNEGKAEAFSAADKSRASVSGKSGMGQAQSQTIYDPTCDECSGAESSAPESLKSPSTNGKVSGGSSAFPQYTSPNGPPQSPQQHNGQVVVGAPGTYYGNGQIVPGQIDQQRNSPGQINTGREVPGLNQYGSDYPIRGPGSHSPGQIIDQYGRPQTTAGLPAQYYNTPGSTVNVPGQNGLPGTDGGNKFQTGNAHLPGQQNPTTSNRYPNQNEIGGNIENTKQYYNKGSEHPYSGGNQFVHGGPGIVPPGGPYNPNQNVVGPGNLPDPGSNLAQQPIQTGLIGQNNPANIGKTPSHGTLNPSGTSNLYTGGSPGYQDGQPYRNNLYPSQQGQPSVVGQFLPDPKRTLYQNYDQGQPGTYKQYGSVKLGEPAGVDRQFNYGIPNGVLPNSGIGPMYMNRVPGNNPHQSGSNDNTQLLPNQVGGPSLPHGGYLTGPNGEKMICCIVPGNIQGTYGNDQLNRNVIPGVQPSNMIDNLNQNIPQQVSPGLSSPQYSLNRGISSNNYRGNQPYSSGTYNSQLPNGRPDGQAAQTNYYGNGARPDGQISQTWIPNPYVGTPGYQVYDKPNAGIPPSSGTYYTSSTGVYPSTPGSMSPQGLGTQGPGIQNVIPDSGIRNQGYGPGPQSLTPGQQSFIPGSQGLHPGYQTSGSVPQGQQHLTQGQVPGPQGYLPGTQGQIPGTQSQIPGTQGQIPGNVAQYQGTQDQMPGLQQRFPGEQGQLPGTQGQIPGNQGQFLVTQGQTPGYQGQHPGTQRQIPGLQQRFPAAQGQLPGTQGQVPGSQGYLPGTQGQIPGTQSHIPGTQGQIPGNVAQYPGTQDQIPGLQQQFPGVQGQLPGTQGQIPGNQGQYLEPQGQKPGQQGLIPGTQSQLSGMQGQLPGTQGQTPGTQGQIPGTQGQVPGIQGQIPGTQGQIPETQGLIPNAQGQLPSTQRISPGTQYIGQDTYQHQGVIPNQQYGQPSLGNQNTYNPSLPNGGPNVPVNQGSFIPSGVTNSNNIPGWGAGLPSPNAIPGQTGVGTATYPLPGTNNYPYVPNREGGNVHLSQEPFVGGSTNRLNTGDNGAPQNVVDPNSIDSNLDDDESEALASVGENANGTTASASSKGGNKKGKAQTQVQGTYTGSGSFSAQAEISDESKGALSEVSGGSHGATSNAQGRGRSSKSQASVQLGSETGSIQTSAQSDGTAHSSNSQVQGSVKGGMADAQARGPGSTSSQAQIGFTPYKKNDQNHDSISGPFVGGGTASAQSSRRTGQSQSQLQGTFKYGITYNGAAQAGSSIDKDAVFQNKLKFNKMDVFDGEVQNNVSTPSLEQENIKTNTKADHPHSDHHTTKAQQETATPKLVESTRSFQPLHKNNGLEYEYSTDKDDVPPEYDDENFSPEGDVEYSDDVDRDEEHQSLRNHLDKKNIEVKQSYGGNTQHIVLGPLMNKDAQVVQRTSEQQPEYNRIYQPGETVPGTGGYTIPAGFTGSVKSISSKDNTLAMGSKGSPSQAQTVSLVPGSGQVRYVTPAPLSFPTHSQSVPSKDLKSFYNRKRDEDKYISVAKSITGALDGNNNVKQQYSHTYYTKSSSCGYFTFTCTMVSGSDGRKKVCRPKIPTNPDGTPIRCN